MNDWTKSFYFLQAQNLYDFGSINDVLRRLELIKKKLCRGVVIKQENQIHTQKWYNATMGGVGIKSS